MDISDNSPRSRGTAAQAGTIHEARDLLKNTIQKASVRPKSGPGASGPEMSPDLAKRMGSAVFSGFIYLFSLVAICALIFHFLF